MVWWLVGSLLCVGLALRTFRHGVRFNAAALLLLLANLVGLGSHLQLRDVDRDWAGFWTRQENRIQQVLGDEMNRLIDRGDAAVAEAASVGADGALVDHLRRIREDRGLEAIAIYDPAGVPVVWDGVHQGEVPTDARLGVRPYVYGETPLYSYLYFTQPLPGGRGVAVGAALLREELPRPLGTSAPDDFITRFKQRHGEEVRVSRPNRAGGEGVFDYTWSDFTLLSLQVLQPSQADRLVSLRLGWIRMIALLVLVSWLLLMWMERSSGRRTFALATALLLAGMLPLGGILGTPRLFSAGDFLLPGPLELPLGRVLALAIASVFLSGLVSGPMSRGPVWGGALVAAVFPAVLISFEHAASPSFLGQSALGWVAYQATLALILALVIVLALRLGAVPGTARAQPILALIGVALSVALAAALTAASRAGAGPPLWTAVLWAVPTAMVAVALGAGRSWRLRSARLAAAAFLGATAALTYAYASRVDARMELAEVEMADLGIPVDPYLEFLLERFARELVERESPVLRPIELLYAAWAGAGLASEGYPMWLTLWEEQNTQREELPVDVVDPRPAAVDSLIPGARDLPLTIWRLGETDVQYVVTVPLANGWMGSAAVPPRRKLLSSTALGPLFAHVDRRTATPLTLVPEMPGEGDPGVDGVVWTRSPVGYVGEQRIPFPEGHYRARFHLALAGPLLLLARGTLLLAAGMTVFVGLGLLGTLARGAEAPGGVRPSFLFTSFRARVTIALFGFFLLSTVAIGVAALRTLAGASLRTATAIGERVADEAGTEVAQDASGLAALALRVGADLVVYRDGSLDRGAVHELVELGLYPGWVPFWIAREFREGDAVLASESGRLGTWEYVMAFRRVDERAAVGTPIPMSAGATALRRREAEHLLAFAILLGAGLSFALALLVGRALARPIQTLQVASERVGAGNLTVRLPGRRSDEFGAVFQAFNRMVQRLSATREELVRATRRTTAIVEEAATGVIATDHRGRVVLVNPRAEAILGQDVRLDRTLAGNRRAEVLATWVGRFLEDGVPEGTEEFEFGERRIRVRGRRTSRNEPYGGAVFSVEDVTDELRAERVLAWGEMARQVAHEVKNPLTPIKLSVQHMQRAWQDGADDFDTVLNRNAEAVLKEIDRLAEIAGSFSRFAAPRTGTQTDLERVDVADVVEEVLALYKSAGDGDRFRARLDLDLPAVSARVGEFKEVLLNLLENARAALGDDGLVEVTGRAGAGSVLITVHDNGAGIPSSQLLHVFEPHFSTRSSGTGLGLAIVKRLVESWGGSVTAESSEGLGTEMHLIVPVWSADPAEDAGPPAS